MLIGVVFSVIGIALLAKAADQFVDGAAKLAILLKVSPVVIGAVIIGFGTSAPEMLVSGVAATRGDTDLGIGNIIGSNIANLSLILGSAALMVRVVVTASVIRREAVLATASAVLFAVFLQGEGVSRLEGLILLLLVVVALGWIIRAGGVDEEVPEVHEEESSVGASLVETLIGLVGTVAGAYLLVEGATGLADEFGLNDGFVGVTMVAIGTSLPELVTTMSAAKKGEVELIVGNLLGSNLFNSLAVGAVVGLLGNGMIEDPSLPRLDTLFMLVVCVGAFIFMLTYRVFSRREGIALLGVFVVFLITTWIQETDSQAVTSVTSLMQMA